MIDEYTLIELVKRHEELYNRSHPDYLNQARRESVWTDIAKELGDIGTTCKERWTRIRENFRKAMQLRKQKMESGLKYRPPKYYNYMAFVIPHLTDEINQPVDSQDQDTGEINGEEDCEAFDSSASHPRKIIKRSISTSEVSIEAAEEVNVQNEGIFLFEPQSNKKNKDDKILTEFFVNMAQTVAKFPLKKQLEIKRKLFNMVHDVEMDLAENIRDVLG